MAFLRWAARRSPGYFFLAPHAPHLALHAPHLAPHLAPQAPHLAAVACAPHLRLLHARHIMPHPLSAAAVTTAEARVLDRVAERLTLVMLLEGGSTSYFLPAQAPHLALAAPHLAPHLAPHFALQAPHLAVASCFLAPHFLALHAPEAAVAAFLGPHLAPAQVAAKAGLDSAAAVTTAEARALERWLERLFMDVSWG